MLACARIGVIHTVVFAGFSADALASRINDAECKVRKKKKKTPTFIFYFRNANSFSLVDHHC